MYKFILQKIYKNIIEKRKKNKLKMIVELNNKLNVKI